MSTTAPCRQTCNLQRCETEEDVILENEWLNITTSEATHQLSSMENQAQTVKAAACEMNKSCYKKSTAIFCSIVTLAMLAFGILTDSISVHCTVQCSCMIVILSSFCYCMI